MESDDLEALIALLQAHTIALSALYAAHPYPATLLARFLLLRARAVENPHPAYSETLNTLLDAIPER